MKSLLFLTVLLLLSSLGFAAMSDYTFQQSTAAWEPITTPTVIHNTGIDDSMSPVINIGFTFILDEQPYTTFKANSNGFITLNEASTASLSNALASTTHIIAGIWDDLMTNTTASHVAYQLTGTAPSRVLTVEYKNMKWYYSTTNLVNFQIKLHESTNQIELIYGAMQTTPGTSASASIGVSAAPAGNYLSITPATPTATYSTTAEFNQINATHIPFLTGNKYTFLPPVAATNDLAALSISGNVTPSVGNETNYTIRIRNRGTNDQSNYQVKILSTDNAELASIPGPTITSGAVLDLIVPWTPTTEGPIAIYGKVVLTGDEVPVNDQTSSINITVMPAGLNVVTIGDGSQNALIPLNFFYRNSLYQNIYFPTEIGMYGNITALTLYNQFTTTTLNNMPTKIWMGMTTLENLSAGFIPASQLTLVYDGNVNYPAGPNSIMIPLQTMFSYTGSNLVIMFNRPMDTTYYSSSDYFKCQTVGTNRARNAWSDSTVFDPLNPGTAGSVTGQFPKTTLYMTPLSPDPFFSISPASHNYGTVIIETTTNQNFTITNAGGGTLSVSSITIDGSPAFTLQNLPTLPANMNTGQTSSFTVAFNPATPGAHTAIVTITDNMTRLPHTVSLSGNAIDTTIYTLPYVQNFDTVIPPALPMDWTRIVQSTVTSAYVQTYTTTPNTAPNCLGMTNSTDATATLLAIAPPLVNTIPVNTTRIRFFGRAGVNNYTIGLGIMTDPLSAATFQQIQSVTLTTTWTEYVISFASYTGTGRYIAIKHGLGGTSRFVYIDTAMIELIPQDDLAALAIAGNSTPSVGAPSNYTVTISNYGSNPQSTYQVKLFGQGDVELASVNGPTIAAGINLDVVVPWTPTTEGATFIYGKVVLTGDQNNLNDQTPNLNVFVNPEGLVQITIGDGSQQARVPIDMYWRNSLFETLIFPAELGNTIGTITGLTFYNNFSSNLQNKPTRIWLGTTTQNDLSGGWIPSGNLTLVFDGNVNYPSGPNTIAIPFQTPYLYLNGQNLVLMVNRPMDTQYFSSLDYFLAQTVGTTRSRMIYSDSETYDPASPPTGGTVSGQFPKTTISIIPGGVGHLTGTVNGAGAQPLEGVTVQFATGGYQATTNAQGQYSIINIVAGTYQVTYSRYGYIDQTINIVIPESEDVIQDVQLVQMPTVTVTGTVTASDTGSGIPGASIILTGFENYNTSTNAQGFFSINSVYANQNYDYTIAAAGYQNTGGTIQVGLVDYAFGTVVLNEVAYAPRQVVAEINTSNTEVNLEWLAPDPNAVDMTEGFENALFPPEGWTQTITNSGAANTLGVFPTWCRIGSILISGVPTGPHSGDWQAGLWWSYEHQDEWLVTPQFNCPPASHLQFWSHVNLGSVNADHYYVKISTDNGSNWTELWDASAQPVGINSYATPILVDLSLYEGQQIRLAWHATDGPGNDGLWYVWFIDDIYIGSETASITFDFDEMSIRSASRAQTLVQTPIPATLPSRAAELNPFHTEPGSPLQQQHNRIKTSSRALTGYRVWRLPNGQETNEAAWTSLTPENVTSTEFVDTGWETLPNGTYRWAIKAVYTSDVLSVPSFSNQLVKDVITGMIAGVVRTVTNQAIPGATVTAGSYTATTNNAGAYSIIVPIGIYNVTAAKQGYVTQTQENINVTANQTTTVNFNLVQGSSNEDDLIPVSATILSGNYPNPFNPETTISYSVKDRSPVRIEIYNLKGQKIRTLVNQDQTPGHYRIVWNGKDESGSSVGSGVYFYRMQAGSYSSTRKMLLME